MSLIQVENMTKVYGAGETAITALDHVSLTVETGEFIAVMGPSGCGKSTLLHLLGGLDSFTEGNLVLDGQTLTKISDDAVTQLRRRKIGFVFQFFNLIPILSSVENAALPLLLDGMDSAKAKQKATEMLTKVGLGDRLASQPGQLSGGQQQRVAIARALVTDPLLVLADEPTGNLDTKASDEIIALLKQIAKEWGRTVIMVTHDPRLATQAERLLTMRDGKIMEDKRTN
jgi:putative ABC transport system ATP-binding protein